MTPAISDLRTLIASMEPVLNPGVYAYCTVPGTTDPSAFQAIGTFREAEATTLILEEAQALEAGLSPLFRCAWITLRVHSDLQAVGLTAAFSEALGRAGVSCNVVAGAYHDHIFVPLEAAERAMAALRALQQG